MQPNSALASLSFVSALALALPFLAVGCTDDGDSDDDAVASTGADGSGDGPGFDEAAVIAEAATYASTLTKVNATATASQHGLADTVNFYVNAEALAAYQMFDPDTPTATPLPEGTLLVKEHLTSEGAEDGFLMMYKAPEGYNPSAADWFWARVDGTGATRETGVVGFCVACHTAVADADFVFGVPLDNRL